MQAVHIHKYLEKSITHLYRTAGSEYHEHIRQSSTLKKLKYDVYCKAHYLNLVSTTAAKHLDVKH